LAANKTAKPKPLKAASVGWVIAKPPIKHVISKANSVVMPGLLMLLRQ
jgi:hypothetical protein